MSDTNTGAPAGVPDPNAPPAGGTPPAAPQRPENVPEKFWDAEKGAVNVDALIQSYAELEKSASKPKDQPSGDPSPDPNAPPADPPATPEARYKAATDKATAELQETGTLSEESYAEFAAQGIPREAIDTYIAGQEAAFELRKIHIEREVGGEESYAAMLAWAASNYAAEDAETYNTTVFGSDKNAAIAAARQLKQRYEDAMGTEGKIITNGSGGGGNGYTSKDEWLTDIRKPEYKRDEKFREQVRLKLEAALKSGVNMGVGASTG